jgi:hypothetical protein
VIQWLDEFYGDPELRSTLMESFLPAFSSYVSEAVGGPVASSFITALAESYVDRHLGSSRAQLQEVLKDNESLEALQARFTEWEEKRPGKVARNELVRSANAAQVEQMKTRGVTRKVWVASGGSCPYCTGLDGRTVAIEEAFFTPDDEYSPEGAESPMTFTSSIGHPPVHQGCDCSISEETETTTVALDEQRLAELADDTDASNANGSQRTKDLALEAGLSQDEADRLAIMAQGWNIDANSFDGWGLRYAASQRGATLGDLPSKPLWGQFVNRYADEYVETADKLLDVSTAEVRRQLGDSGTIRVYRGMTMGSPIDGIPTDGSVVEAAIEQRPLSSWSLSKEEATKFAGTSAEEYGGAAYVLEMDVPVTDVAGLAGTGLGNGAHGEVVLFGRPEHVARVFVPQD